MAAAAGRVAAPGPREEPSSWRSRAVASPGSRQPRCWRVTCTANSRPARGPCWPLPHASRSAGRLSRTGGEALSSAVAGRRSHELVGVRCQKGESRRSAVCPTLTKTSPCEPDGGRVEVGLRHRPPPAAPGQRRHVACPGASTGLMRCLANDPVQLMPARTVILILRQISYRTSRCSCCRDLMPRGNTPPRQAGLDGPVQQTTPLHTRSLAPIGGAATRRRDRCAKQFSP